MTQHFVLPGTEEAVNVFYLLVDDPDSLDQSTTNTLADIAHQAWHDNLRTKTATAVLLDYIRIKDIHVENGNAFQKDYSEAGTNSNDPLPNNVAGVVSWRTAKTGKSFRGRSYLPGFVETVSDGLGPDSATLGALQGYGDDMISGFTSGAPLQVGSFTLSLTTAITAAVARTMWHSQRRRQPRG